MINYVLGFLFSEDKKKVCLIRKTKPEIMSGKLNGVGGKIELSDLNIKEAMVREFKEETGVSFPHWEFVTTMSNPQKWKVYLFRSFDKCIEQVQSTTEEEIITVPVDSLFQEHTLFNIKWLIPMLLDENLQIPNEFIYF